MESIMDDSLVSYIEKRLMHDINNAEDFIDPRSAPPSGEARRAGDHQINRIVEELTLALGSAGEARQTHLRTARVLLAMIAPRD
jgi:hypothetical protein